MGGTGMALGWQLFWCGLRAALGDVRVALGQHHDGGWGGTENHTGGMSVAALEWHWGSISTALGWHWADTGTG